MPNIKVSISYDTLHKLQMNTQKLREALGSIKDYLTLAQTADDFKDKDAVRMLIDSARTAATQALQETK